MLSTNIENLLETLKILTSNLTKEHAFQANLTFLLQTLSTRHGFLRPHIILFDPETGLLKLRVAQDAPKNNHADYSPGKGVTGQVFATGKPVIVPCIKESSLFANLLFERTEDELESMAFICVPVLGMPFPGDCAFVPREVIGTLGIDLPSCSEKELKLYCEFLEIVANLIAVQAVFLQDKATQTQSTTALLFDANQEGNIFIAQSKRMKLVLEQAIQLAQNTYPILLYGERGTGKEFLAKRIHAMSERKYLPFITCYCTHLEINEIKLKSHLLGYVKNTFPTAKQTQKGLFELAHLGTLYFDAIDTLSPIAQEILLDVLTNNKIQRLGGNTPVTVDVRIICSSTVPLEDLVEQGLFNSELSLRLSAYTCSLPALRDHREDIIPLAEYFLKEHAKKQNIEVKRISYPALDLLTSYYFAGNLSELRQTVEYALENCEDSVIRASDLPPSVQTASSSNTKSVLPLTEAVAYFEKELIVDALVKAQGNMFKAAQDLKTTYRIINYKVKKYDIDSKKFQLKS